MPQDVTLAMPEMKATLDGVTHATSRQLLESLYHETLVALHPGGAVRVALEQRESAGRLRAPIHLIGLGKAAPAMCAAALEWHATRQRTLAGGICISHDPGGVSVAPLPVVIGDHPVPGVRSHRAAAALGAYIAARVKPDDDVIVLLSGGTSSLIGAPLPGMSEAQYDTTIAALIASGLSIMAINRERSRLSRWAAGQLGFALKAQGATVEVLVISDVIGDDPAFIGSGPCAAPSGLPAIPIAHHTISNNGAARSTVVSLATKRGLNAMQVTQPLEGDVEQCADRISLALRTFASTARTGSSAHLPRVMCWGGEPTVTLPGPDAPAGGRMQALALLIAKQLHDAGKDAHGITVLCAGTDGRDGATNAAGAVIDAYTWSRIHEVGRTPERDLRTFHSHQALQAVHAIVPEFASGTNVNDLVIALVT